MPIYEYQCTGCHHHFDVIQKMNDDPVKACPKCSENKAIRLVSAAGFQLKGSGWYVTDFKTKDKVTTTSEKTSTEAKPSADTTKTEAPSTTTGSESK